MPRGKAARGALDEVDRRLVVALSRDGRRSAAALAKELGLSRQAVTDRIRDLERRGVIRGYRADVDPLALGLEVRAQLRLTLDATAPASREKEVLRRLSANPLVRSVYRVSGEDCFVAEVQCRRIEDVSALIGAAVVAHRVRAGDRDGKGRPRAGGDRARRRLRA